MGATSIAGAGVGGRCPHRGNRSKVGHRTRLDAAQSACEETSGTESLLIR